MVCFTLLATMFLRPFRPRPCSVLPRFRPIVMTTPSAIDYSTTSASDPANVPLDKLLPASSTIRLFDSIPKFREWRREVLLRGETVGFVPTMGALHEGHMGLVTLAKNNTTHVAISIFVNPAQFAPHEDLARYPRTLPTDLEQLSSLGPGVVSAVLVPSVADMYPSGITLEVANQKGAFVEVKGMSHQMEGVTRPAFFRGVATVVSKLFNIIQPDVAFFGQKDIQQCMVIRNLIRDLQFPIRLYIAPTARDPHDGLALSSRNRYLTLSQRPHAVVLYRALCVARTAHEQGARDREAILAPAHAIIEEVAREVREMGEGWEIKLDYISMANPETLEEVEGKVGESGFILSGAVYVGTTRLIDNLVVGVEL